jgi:hypothetical protein
VTFPNPEGYDDRKAVLVVRQDLDDDSKEIMGALHGGGLIHLAFRPEKGANIQEAFRITGAASTVVTPIRIGIEKHGDSFRLFLSQKGEPMHPVGETVTLPFEGPFYIGVGFCSHLPVTADSTLLTDVVLENSAEKIR